MRWSNLFIPTLREDPADAEVTSHRLLVRAGYIRQLTAGVYSLLPLAQRVRLKVIQIIREEMNRAGGQEFVLPAIHPAEVWKESGRWEVMGDNMFRLKDRKGVDMALGMTHEEISHKMSDIEQFSELGEYLSLPVRTYSTGMQMRLGFAIATAIDPEILILDEGLSAGDARFAERAKRRVDDLVERCSILVLASHSEDLIQSMCNKAVVLRSGRLIEAGSVGDMVEAYHQLNADQVGANIL